MKRLIPICTLLLLLFTCEISETPEVVLYPQILITYEGNVIKNNDLIEFEKTLLHTNSSKEIMITNTGEADLSIYYYAIEGDYDFGSNNDITDIVLRPDSSYMFTITFNPYDEATKESTFEIVSNDPDANSFKLRLRGSGQKPGDVIVTGDEVTNNPRPTWTWIIPPKSVQLKYRFNGGHWYITDDLNITSYSPDRDLTDGYYSLEVQVKYQNDLLSNLGYFTIRIDTTPPYPPIVSGVTSTNSLRPTWRWTIPSDAKSIRYSFDGDSWQDLGHIEIREFTPQTDLAEGSHVLLVQARDEIGNWSEAGEHTITIDRTGLNPPVVTGDTITNNLKPDWRWSIPHGSNSVRFRLDSGEWIVGYINLRSFVPEQNLSEGDHVLEVQVKDYVGNWSNSGSHIITIDSTAPASPVVNGSTPTNNLKPTWSWNIPAESCKVRYRLNNSSWVIKDDTETVSYTPVSDLSERVHTLEVQVMDIAGNWSLSGTFSIEIDLSTTSAPIVNGETSTSNLKPTWNWNIPVGAVNIRYSLDGNSWVVVGNTSVTSFSPDNNLSEGNHTFKVQTQNNLLNWSPAGIFVTEIDITPPAKPVVTGVVLTNDKAPTWSWNIPDSSTDIRLRINSSEWSILGSTNVISYTPVNDLSEGDHLFEVQVVDSNGNWSESGKFTTRVDSIAPLKPSLSDLTVTTDPRPTWSWDVSAGASKFSYRINEGSWVNTSNTNITSYTPANNLDFGINKFEIKAGDEAGNWSSAAEDTVEVLLGTPENLISSNDRNNGIRVSWDRVSGAQEYRVFRSTSAQSGYVLIKTTTYSSYFDEDIPTGVKHYYKVQAATVSGVESEVSGYSEGECYLSNPPYLYADNGSSASYIEVRWGKTYGATKYILYRSEDQNSGFVEIYQGTNTLYQDTDATGLTPYYYYAKAWSQESGLSGSSSTDDGCLKLKKPTLLSVSNGEYKDHVLVEWSSVEGAEKYEVLRSSSESGGYFLMDVMASTSYKDTDVVLGQRYFYKIRSKANVSDYSDYSIIRNGFKGIPEPEGLSATVDRVGDIKISWDMISGDVTYDILRSTMLGGTYTKIATVSRWSDYYIDETAQMEKEYYYNVSARNELTGSAMSNLVVRGYSLFRTTTPMVDKGRIDTMISVRWIPDPGISYYSLYRTSGDPSDFNSYEKVVSTSRHIVNDFDVEKCTKYYYVLTAHDSVLGETEPSEPVEGWLRIETPTEVSASESYIDYVHIKWNGVLGATNYDVSRSTSTDGTYRSIGGVSTDGSVQMLRYEDDYATPGETHYYRITASNSIFGESTVSECVAGKKGGPDAPINISATDDNPTNVILNWDPVIGNTKGYKIYRSTKINSDYTFVGRTDSTTYSDNSGVYDTYYYYRISSDNVSGESGYSYYVKGKRK